MSDLPEPPAHEGEITWFRGWLSKSSLSSDPNGNFTLKFTVDPADKWNLLHLEHGGQGFQLLVKVCGYTPEVDDDLSAVLGA